MCDKHCIVIMFCAIILSKYLDHHTIPLRMMATAIHNFILFHRLKCASISVTPIDIFHFLKIDLFTAHWCYCRFKFEFTHLNSLFSSRTASVHRCARLGSQLLQKNCHGIFRNFLGEKNTRIINQEPGHASSRVCKKEGAEEMVVVWGCHPLCPPWRFKCYLVHNLVSIWQSPREGCLFAIFSAEDAVLL